jgi:hypothetical protein
MLKSCRTLWVAALIIVMVAATLWSRTWMTRAPSSAVPPQPSMQEPSSTIVDPKVPLVDGSSNAGTGKALRLPSKAPWASFNSRLQNREFAWVVSNARSAPAEGSYVLASRALAICMTLRAGGSDDAQEQRIQSEITASGDTKRARLEALRELSKACAPLGNFSEMRRQREALSSEMRSAGDALEGLFQEAMVLASGSLPRETRVQRVAEILEMDDPIAVEALKPVLTAPGASLNGQAIPRDQLGLYQAAWDLAICEAYGQCRGTGSTWAMQECLQYSRCDYLDTWGTVLKWLPDSIDRTHQYSQAIQANIISRRFAHIGIP